MMATLGIALRWNKRPKRSPRDSAVALTPKASTTSDNSPGPGRFSEPSLDVTVALSKQSSPASLTLNGSNRTFYEDSLTGDSIRLLRIEPGEHDDAVSCSLLCTSLEDDQCPEYTAISYCWGPDSQPMTSIKLDHRDGFRVTKHLRDGLRRLRRTGKPRYVWADAICINQDDTSERGHQVDRMRQIFGRAYSVIIWLGEIRRSDKVPTCSCHVPRGEGHPSQAVCCEPGLSSLEHGHVDQAIQSKLHNDERRSRGEADPGHVWWKRLWVIQEFCVSKWLPTVCVGPHTISWDFFTSLLWPQRSDHILQRLRHSPRQSLHELLLSTTNDFYCSEPRDRIYALLGLLNNDGSQNEIVADYNKPVAAVFEEAMLYIIRTEGTLDCLLDERTDRRFDNRKDEGGQQFPTWIPRFAYMRDYSTVRTPDGFSAGYHTPAVRLLPHRTSSELCNCESHNVLQVRGIIFDDILHKVDMSKLFTVRSSTRCKILEQLDVDYSKPPRFKIKRAPNIGHLMLEFLFAGTEVSVVETVRRASQEIITVPGRTYIPKHVYCEQLATEFGFSKTDSTILDLTVAATFEDLFKKKVIAKDSERHINTKWGKYVAPAQNQERVFFSTASGYTGIGPVSLEVRDKIIVPFGSSRPFIIRDHGDHYILIGDTVVPGIMSGQLMDLHQHDEMHVTDVCLK